MKRERPPYLKQKPIFYFDEDFPRNVFEAIKATSLKNKFRFKNTDDEGYRGKLDEPLFEICRKRKYTLIALDKGFNDNRKYPLNGMPGIVILHSSTNDNAEIFSQLKSFFEFIDSLPFPKIFLGDSKFNINNNGCTMIGRHVETREIKKMKIIAGVTTTVEVWNYFNK